MIVAKNISKIYFEGSKKEFYAIKNINFEKARILAYQSLQARNMRR